MEKSGLLALADAYGLERAELEQLKLLCERFFDQLREELMTLVNRSFKMTGLAQGSASFVEFFNGARDHHFASLGFNDEAPIAVHIENSLASAVIASILNIPADTSADADPSKRGVTMTEEYILANSLGEAMAKAAAGVFAIFFDNRAGLRLLRMEHRPSLIADTLAPAERMATASVDCMADGIGGRIELGLPLSIIMPAKALLTQTHVKHSNPEAAPGKLRSLLSTTPVELEAVLGRLTMPLAGVRALVPGSVLMLQKAPGGMARVELQCGGQALLTGTVVEHRGWRRFMVHEKEEN